MTGDVGMHGRGCNKSLKTGDFLFCSAIFTEQAHIDLDYCA
ncbi:hypothetical protein [Parvularcula sp. IMCC14364]|nr:hypothetical protein [Parvularcula sp. IMCC14364]